MTEKEEKKKVQDLTMGASTPSEKFVTLADGTQVRLEDPTHPKTKEEIEKERTTC